MAQGKKYDVARINTVLKRIRAGLTKLPSTMTGITVKGTTFTPTTLDTKLGGYQTVFDTADSAHQSAMDADEAAQAIGQEAGEFVAALVMAFKAALGRHSAALEVVGVTPDKVPDPLSAEATTQKVARNLATRKARHTVGKKAKAKIHGQVPPTGTPPAGTPPAGP